MKYEIRRAVTGSGASSELSPEAYTTISAAYDNLPSVLFIEEQFDLLIANYMELENDLLAMATSIMVIRPDIPSIQRERNFIVNRRLLNLLSACRGYLDQTPHRLNVINHDDESAIVGSDFETYANFEYDSWLEYRVMDAMRNYTQHAGFPVEVRYQREWVGEDAHKKQRFAVMPYIEVWSLEKSFKSKPRKELEGFGDNVPIMPMVRQYVASLGNIHERVRAGLRSSIDMWEGATLDAIKRFHAENPGERKATRVAVEKADRRWKRVVHLDALERQIEYRRALVKRNGGLGALPRRYVTSESGEA